MKKILFAILPVLAILLLVTGCGKKVAGPANEGQPAPVGEALSGSIPDLLAKGRSIKCELVADAQSEITSGTTYVAGGKFRSDYEMKVAGQANMKAHSLSDGTWLYSWEDSHPEQAGKFKMADMEKASAQAENKGAEDYNANFNYKCYNWQADNNLLTPPAGIEFKDYSEIMKQAEQMQQGSAGAAAGKATMCGQCETLSSKEAKSACKQGLGC